jgi:hypothetical protein
MDKFEYLDGNDYWYLTPRAVRPLKGEDKMAHATVKEVITEKVILELSSREASVLFRMLCRVSGSYDGYRGDSANILDALGEVGVKDLPQSVISGYLSFNDNVEAK